MEYMFVLFGVFAVIMVFLAYRQGLKDGPSLAEKKDVKPFFSYKPEKESNVSEAELERRDEADFVDTYQ